MTLPAFLDRKWRLQLPGCVFTLVYVFLFCAVFLGEVLSFYYAVPHWDTLLHFFSGVMLGILGFSLARRLNGTALSPLLAATFAFCFALAAGAVWEIYEYVMDGILQMNMQKFANAQQVDYVGRRALRDTMKDVIVDALSALLTAAVGYGIVRKRRCRY